MLFRSATVPVGSAPRPVISSLEPGQGDIDMRDVGAVRLSQNSSSAEIVRVIEAYNALPPAKKK